MADEARKAAAAENTSLVTKVRDFFSGVKTEYSKIIFPNSEDLKKQTTATLIVSVFIGLLIFVIDFVFKYLLGFIL
ncbi:MAG: preprotein translocase subunit SecE [Lachnospiraceae bacterium]|jgi:preprotein translocase subunit SecE|nr:preprotein translocase subunit SecE [Lachnospiraceae bacterium]MBQ4239878.1 preprotein translocase subunit SecE [Oscillospiraceae bacterium]